jgi:DNA-binding transcriptional LysR family regulator
LVENSVMKNMQGLIAFVETAAGGSLTAAAERLGVSP